MSDTLNPFDYGDISSCTACGNLGRYHVPADGADAADVMVIGGVPSKHEADSKRPFDGAIGEAVEFMLEEAGLIRQHVYMTYALKCHIPGNPQREPLQGELRNCRMNWLQLEIEAIDPKVVVLIGKQAHQAVVPPKIPFEHGRISPNRKYTALTLGHPGYFIRRGNIQQFIMDGGYKLRELLK